MQRKESVLFGGISAFLASGWIAGFFGLKLLWAVPAAPGAQTEGMVGESKVHVSTWLETLEARFAALYETRVVLPFRKSVEEVRSVYRESLVAGLEDMLRIGNKQDAVVFREEAKRFEEDPTVLPVDDSDLSSGPLRAVRRQLREGLSEVERQRERSVRQLMGEFDAALVQGARQLAARQMLEDAALVQKRRQDVGRLWLPLMKGKYPDVRPLEGVATSGDQMPKKSGKAGTVVFTRKGFEEAVRLVVEAKGSLTVRSSGRVIPVRSMADLPGGKVEVLSVSLYVSNLKRPLIPGEILKLAQLRGAETFHLFDFHGDPEELFFLGNWRQLHSLFLINCRMDMSLAGRLANCSQLRSLNLAKSERVSGEFVNEVTRAVSGLSDLNLTGCDLDDSVGVSLARQEKMESLLLGSTPLTTAVLPHLAGLRALKHLELFDQGWSEEGLKVLGDLNLEYLGPLDTNRNDFVEQVEWVGRVFPKLQRTALQGGTLNAVQADALAKQLKNLSALDLGIVHPEVGAFEALSRLHHLETLACHSRRFGDPELALLLEIRTLRSLDLWGTQVSEQSLDLIQKAAHMGLKVLNVSRTKISRAAAQEFNSRSLPLKIGVDAEP